jgi:hypothetical protein
MSFPLPRPLYHARRGKAVESLGEPLLVAATRGVNGSPGLRLGSAEVLAAPRASEMVTVGRYVPDP